MMAIVLPFLSLSLKRARTHTLLPVPTSSRMIFCALSLSHAYVHKSKVVKVFRENALGSV